MIIGSFYCESCKRDIENGYAWIEKKCQYCQSKNINYIPPEPERSIVMKDGLDEIPSPLVANNDDLVRMGYAEYTDDWIIKNIGPEKLFEMFIEIQEELRFRKEPRDKNDKIH